ncbi:hypothetical protein FQR65_LT01322 [Abscondita terminalis]|nr:hypothetical protein FQR65_LT01322 [Abscondita terminalis]
MKEEQRRYEEQQRRKDEQRKKEGQKAREEYIKRETGKEETRQEEQMRRELEQRRWEEEQVFGRRDSINRTPQKRDEEEEQKHVETSNWSLVISPKERNAKKRKGLEKTIITKNDSYEEFSEISEREWTEESYERTILKTDEEIAGDSIIIFIKDKEEMTKWGKKIIKRYPEIKEGIKVPHEDGHYTCIEQMMDITDINRKEQISIIPPKGIAIGKKEEKLARLEFDDIHHDLENLLSVDQLNSTTVRANFKQLEKTMSWLEVVDCEVKTQLLDTEASEEIVRKELSEMRDCGNQLYTM